ncbi:MAG: hypothetical protein HQ559_03620 [Lentisphaerae bacterium]|nr:hypothetical protein [Lentisphaerota bacterium]
MTLLTRLLRNARFASVVLAALIASSGQAADAWKHFTKEDTPGLPGDEIQFVGAARGGGVWIGTLDGVASAQGGTFTPLKNEQGTIKLRAWTVLENEKDTWVGHEGGITLIRGNSRSDWLSGLTVAPIVPVRPDVLWAIGTTRAGLAKLSEYRDKNWTTVGAVAKRRITNLFRTNDGRLWLTIDGNGVLEIDPATGIDKAVHHLQGFNVTSLTKDSRGVIWCGLWANGIAGWDGTSWHKELPKIKRSAVLSIVEDAKATLWVATSASGLWRRPLIKAEWTQDLADEGAINLLVATSDGRVWISGQTTGGLRYWSGTEWILSLDSPLPIRTLVEAKDGTLWAGGVLDGVYQLKK